MATYKIAGLVVRTLFSHVSVEDEFAEYSVPEVGRVDVVVEIVEETRQNIPAALTMVAEDEFKSIATKGDEYYFIYREGWHILFSRLSVDALTGSATISICVDRGKSIAEIPRWAIRSAIMYPFFAYLISNGIFPLHSCGLSLDGRGILVSGTSGSGKSTIGKILVERYGAKYLGEDVNACLKDGHFSGMPFSRIINNAESCVHAVFFLGNKTGRLSQADIADNLMKSDFAIRGLRASVDTVVSVAKCFSTCKRCFMISRKGQTEDETASLVYDLAFGRKEL